MQNLKIWLVGILGSTMLRLLRVTVTLKIIDPTGALEYASHSPILGAFWHRQQIMMVWLYLEGFPKKGRKPAYVLSSRSLDGRFMAKVMNLMGVSSIYGSSSRGGAEALLKINRLVKDGSHMIFTPDGPKGPLHKVKGGIIYAASNTGAPVLPTALAASSFWTFGSWDKMFLPKPFSRICIYVGERINIPAGINDSEVEQYQLKLENALNEASACAQKML